MHEGGDNQSYDEIPTRFDVPADQRRYEDYQAGDVFNFASPLTVGRAAVLAFAAEFDSPRRPRAARAGA
jgi:hypothetical protein